MDKTGFSGAGRDDGVRAHGGLPVLEGLNLLPVLSALFTHFVVIFAVVVVVIVFDDGGLDLVCVGSRDDNFLFIFFRLFRSSSSFSAESSSPSHVLKRLSASGVSSLLSPCRLLVSVGV